MSAVPELTEENDARPREKDVLAYLVRPGRKEA